MKKLFIIGLLSFVFFAFSVQPSSAAGNPSFLEKIKSSVTNSLQRVYLSLPGDKPGTVVMNQAAAAMLTVKSEQINADITMDFQNADQSLASLKLHLDGPMKMDAVANPQSYQQDLHVTGTFSMQGTSLQTDANLKMTDQKIYFRLNEVPLVPYFDLATLKGRWLSADATKKDGQASTAWTTAQQAKIQQANTDLLKKSQISPAQKVTKDNHAVYVVDMTVPKSAILDYLDIVQKIQAETNPESEDDALKTSQRAAMEKILADVSEIKITFWVDRSTFYMRHVELPVTYTRPQNEVASAMVGANNPLASIAQFNTVKLSLVMNFDKFNESVSFEEPTNAEDAQQVLQNIMMGGAQNLGVPTSSSNAKKVPSTLPTELPNLTPQQRMQLEKFNQMNLPANLPVTP